MQSNKQKNGSYNIPIVPYCAFKSSTWSNPVHNFLLHFQELRPPPGIKPIKIILSYARAYRALWLTSLTNQCAIISESIGICCNLLYSEQFTWDCVRGFWAPWLAAQKFSTNHACGE